MIDESLVKVFYTIFLVNLILDSSKTIIPKVLSSLNRLIKAISNCFQEAIDLAARLKNHVDALPTKV